VFAYDLHVTLALASIVAMLLVAGEGAVRLVRAQPPAKAASAGWSAVAVLLGMTAAGGLALLAGGQRPKEFLHLVYALLAFGAGPPCRLPDGPGEPASAGAGQIPWRAGRRRGDRAAVRHRLRHRPHLHRPPRCLRRAHARGDQELV